MSQTAGQQPRRWAVSPSPEIIVGRESGEDAYLFQSIAYASLLPDGGIVVADNSLLDIRFFDETGSFRKRIGGRGQGPGEFLHIGGMWITGGGWIAVWDARNLRITTIDSAGSLKGAHRVGGQPAGSNLQAFIGTFSDDEVVLASLQLGPRAPEAVPDRWILGRFGLDGRYRGPWGEVRGMRRFNGFAVPFSAMPASAFFADTVFLADGYEAHISIRDKRGLGIRTITLQPVMRSSPAAARAALETEVQKRSSASTDPFVKVLVDYLAQDRVPRQEQVPQIGGLLVDDLGYVWVKTYDPNVDSIWLRAYPTWPGAGGDWRVIARDGEVVAEVRLPSTVRPLQVKGNRLLAVATDSLGIQRIVVHHLRR